MSDSITLDIQNEHIAIITLNRPEAMNAMSLNVLDQLNASLDEISNNKAIRAIIITAAGNRAFCAGADLKERKGMSNEDVIKTVQYIGNTVNRIEQMAVPVIAGINGAAIGGGLELALACDIRIAANDVKMGLTETSLAIIPGAGGTQRLSRLIGNGHAKRLIFTASLITSDEAFSIGLIEQLTSKETVMVEALQMAEKIASNGPIGVQMAKQAINKGTEVDLHSGLSIEHLCYRQTIQTKDRLEGLVAFREKRKPKYTGE